MKRSFFFLFIGLGVALAALLLATPVHAQDLGPAPGATPAVEPVTVEEAPPAPAAPAQEVPAPTELLEWPPPEVLAEPAPELSAPVEEAPPVEAMALAPGSEAAPVEQAPEAAAPDEVLAETGIVLADERGAALPLTSGGDPYFTVGATTYRFYKPVGACGGAPNCWDGLAAPITAAIDKVWQAGLIPNDRRIYVEADTYTEPVTIDATAHAALGQLMGLIGGVAAPTDPLGVGDPNRILNGDVHIKGSLLGFTLEGFQINGNVWIENGAGAVTLKNLVVRGDTLIDKAILVDNMNGPVAVDHVDASQSPGPGLVIDNHSLFSAVTITNSRFDSNVDLTRNVNGLDVQTKGPIMVNGVSASLNGGNGAVLISTLSTVTVRNSAMYKNVPTYADPGRGYGLWIDSYALTTVDNVVADENDKSGVRANSSNSVTLTNVHTHANGLDGVDVAKPDSEANPAGPWNVAGGTVVTLTGIDSEHNGRAGILVTANSAITLYNVRGVDNGNYGALLNNCRWNGSACVGIGNISVTSGDFEGRGHQDYGLVAVSRGSVLLNSVWGYANTLDGAYIDNSYAGAYGVVTISGTPTSNTIFNGNGDCGLLVYSRSSITLNYVEAGGNGDFGAYLGNDIPGSAGAVTVNDSSFSGNQFTGLNVESRGAISLYRVDANGNGKSGSGNGASLDNSNATYPMPVTVYTSGFWENAHGLGLDAHSKGFISVYGISAGRNGDTGARLYNSYFGLASGVSVIGASTSPLNPYSDFYQNGGKGMEIMSNGAVSVINCNLNENDGGGLAITGSTAFSSATLTNVFADNNGSTGVGILSYGAVSWTNGRANGNGWQGGFHGVVISNQVASYPYPVTLTNIEIHNSNTDGLQVTSKGAITLGNASLENNSNGNGAVLDNAAGPAGMVYIYNARFDNSGGWGLDVDSKGYLLLSSVFASNCGGGGIMLDNSTSTYYVGVTFTHGTTDNNQGDDGLGILSNGFVTLSDVSSNNNALHGVIIDNRSDLASGVTFIGGSWGNTFNDNGESGFNARSSGAVTLFNLDASNNQGIGLLVYNRYGTSGPVTIYGTLPGWRNSFDNNGGTGVMVYTYSAITLYNISARSNTWSGAMLDNQEAAYPLGVTIINGEFTENQNGDGLAVYSKGAVTVNYIDAERNSVDWAGNANVGETYRDHLTNWDSDGDSWWIELNGSTSLSVAMDVISGGMDPYLCLYNETGSLIGQNDNGGGGVNALLTVDKSLLPAGMYRIQATQAGDRENSEYLLAVNDPGKVQDRDPASNIYIDNSGWDGSVYKGAGAVSINGLYNDWTSSNHAALYGIRVKTNGGLLMSYVESSTNGTCGILVDDTSSLVSAWTNIRADDNPNGGALVSTRGTYFSIYNGEFNDNDLSGLELVATSGTGASFTSLTNIRANDNGYYGMSLMTRGPVMLVNLEANSNGENGAYIDNTTGSSLGYVYLLGTSNTFSDNEYGNLSIFSDGSVLLMNTDANASHLGDGAVINNSSGTGSITIQGAYAYPGWYSSFCGNHWDGLVLSSKGAISLYNVRALDNGHEGALVNNDSATLAPWPVTITQSEFSSNHGGDNGLMVHSRGQVTLTTVRALGNNNNGVWVDNASNAWVVPLGVTVLNSSFSGNKNGSGLGVESKGSILGYTITSFGNGSYGAYLDNRKSGSTGTVSLYGSYGESGFSGNNDTGLVVHSYKAVTLSSLSATDNETHGVGVFTDGPVTISQGRFNNNDNNGLWISAAQLVTLSYLRAIMNGSTSNDGDGIYVTSHGANVTLGYSTLTANFGNGIEVQHGAGTLTLTSVYYLGNDRDMDEAPDNKDNVNSYF